MDSPRVPAIPRVDSSHAVDRDRHLAVIAMGIFDTGESTRVRARKRGWIVIKTFCEDEIRPVVSRDSGFLDIRGMKKVEKVEVGWKTVTFDCVLPGQSTYFHPKFFARLTYPLSILVPRTSPLGKAVALIPDAISLRTGQKFRFSVLRINEAVP